MSDGINFVRDYLVSNGILENYALKAANNLSIEEVRSLATLLQQGKNHPSFSRETFQAIAEVYGLEYLEEYLRETTRTERDLSKADTFVVVIQEAMIRQRSKGMQDVGRLMPQRTD